MSQPSGLFTYVYDPARRISTLTNPESQVTSWLYDGASRVTANLLANGVTVPYTYDHANRILLLAYLTSAAQHFRASTTPTTASAIEPGLLKRMEMSSPGLDDPTYRLTAERRSGSNSYAITYADDRVGNRTLLLNNGSPTTNTYNAANELATSQTTSGGNDQHLRR